MTAAAVLGVGTSSFGVARDRSAESLAWQAAEEALTDSGLEPKDIDAVWVGTVFGPAGLAPRVARGLGLAGRPILKVEAACASGTVAFHEAVTAVRLGRHRRVLAPGVETLDRKSVVEGTRVSVRVGIGGRRTIKKKLTTTLKQRNG